MSAADVRFAPKATELLHRPETSQWARNGLVHCGKTASHFATGPT